MVVLLLIPLSVPFIEKVKLIIKLIIILKIIKIIIIIMAVMIFNRFKTKRTTQNFDNKRQLVADKIPTNKSLQK